MAKYTELEKISEDEVAVVYRFGPGDGRWGLIRFDKSGAGYSELEPIPGETTPHHLHDAVARLVRARRSGNPYPEKMVYAT